MSDAPLIAVDIGNSSTKIGWRFEISDADVLPIPDVTRSFVTAQRPPADLCAALPRERCRWHIASVHREGTRMLQAWLASNREHDVVHVVSHRDLPIDVRLEFPDRVGLDRL